MIEFIKKNKVISSFFIALFACFAMYFLTKDNVIVNSHFFSNNIFIYFVILGFYFISFHSIDKIKKNKLKLSLCFSFLFTLAFVLGQSLDINLTIFKLKNILVFVLLMPFIFCVSNLFFGNLKQIKNGISKLKINEKIENFFFKPTKKCYFACFFFLILCYIPVFLAFFPGIFTYDSIWQVAFFIKKDFVEIHPLLHNYLMILILILNYFFDSEYIGMVAHSVFQVSMMSLIFSYCIYFLAKYNVNHYLKLFALLFFALHPMFSLFMLTTTKDVLFSGCTFLFILQLIDYFQNRKNYFNSNKNKICMVLTVFFIFALRHNGMPAYILFLPLLLYFSKKDFKRALIVFIAPLLLFSLYSQIKIMNNIAPSPIASALGIPLQQMGLVRKKYSSELPSEEKMLFRKLVTKENELAYLPKNADKMKFQDDFLHSFTIEEELKQPFPYINLYLKWGLKYPKDYIDAMLLLNYTYWYPNMNYKPIEHHMFMYAQGWDNAYGVKIGQKSFLPGLRDKYGIFLMFNQFEKYPFLTLLCSMQGIFWINILGIFVVLYQKKYKLCIPLIFNLTLLFGVFFGPIALVRYIYFLYISTPLIFALIFSDFKKNVSKNIK